MISLLDFAWIIWCISKYIQDQNSFVLLPPSLFYILVLFTFFFLFCFVFLLLPSICFNGIKILEHEGSDS